MILLIYKCLLLWKDLHMVITRQTLQILLDDTLQAINKQLF